MSLIAQFNLPGQPNAFIRLPKGRSSANSTIIVVGENGSRKSLLLRQLLLCALNETVPKPRRPFFEGAEIVNFSRMPSQVVAISATATDRFPPRERRMVMSRMKYDVDQYVYVGPRSGRNIVSRSHSTFELIRGLLKNPNILRDKKDLFEEVCHLIGAPALFEVELRVRLAVVGADKGTLKAHVDELLRRSKEVEKKSVYASFIERLKSLEVQNLIDIFDTCFAHRMRVAEKGGRHAERYSIRVEFDVSTGRIDTGQFSLDAVLLAFEVGYLSTRHVSFDFGDHDALSAGQWALFSTVFSLAAVAKDGSLVLIDEPENGLHPDWQRRYPDLIQRALAHVRGCQVFLATHAPMLVGAVSNKHAHILTLHRSPWLGEISASLHRVHRGWDANSIIESVFYLDTARSRETEVIVGHALELVAQGREIPAAQKHSVVRKLCSLADSLPESDPLLVTIRTIQGVLER